MEHTYTNSFKILRDIVPLLKETPKQFLIEVQKVDSLPVAILIDWG